MSLSILHISDTHGLHKALPELPEADVLVHSGDFTQDGTKEEIFDFVNWFCDLPYSFKIFVGGNHDDILAGGKLDGLDENCHYLDGDSVIIQGLKFYSIPMFVKDQLSGRFLHQVNHIPSDTDVLITH